GRVVRPIARVATGLEVPNEEVLDSIDHLFRQVDEMNRLLLDPAVTSVRIVLNPEKMVLAEARRSFTYLNLFGFNTDAVVVNRVLPEGAGADCFSGWRPIQARSDGGVGAALRPLAPFRGPGVGC